MKLNKAYIPCILFWISTILLLLSTFHLKYVNLTLLHLMPATHAPDSDSYLKVTQNILAGHWTAFPIRTPGYPLFLAAIIGIFHSLKFLTAIQSGFSIAAALFFLYACYKHCWPTVLFAAFTLHFLLKDGAVWQTFILTDGVFTSIILCGLASIIMGIHTRKTWYLLSASLCMGLAFLIRPVAIAFLPPYALLLLYMWRMQFTKKILLSFATPFLFIMLALCSYNFFMGGFFNFSLFGQYSLGAATSYYWTEDANHTTATNQMIQKMHASPTKQEREILDHSWNVNRLAPIYIYYYCPNFYQYIFPFYKEKYANLSEVEQSKAIASEIKSMSLLTITKQPKQYTKFVFTQVIAFVAHITRSAHHGKLDWPLLLYLFLFISIAHALIRWIKSSFRDQAAFVITFLTTTYFSYILVVSLVNVSISRLVYPVGFLPYIIIIFYPTLFAKYLKKIASTT